VTGQEQTSEPATVQVIFQGNSLPIFIAVLVVLFIAAIVVPITLNRRRRLLATAASAAEPPAALPAAVATSAEAVGKAYLVSEGGPTAGARWLLAQDEIIVGRSRTRADVVVTGRTASRQHARITCAGDDFIYVDLNPENPSLINGQEPSGPHTLEEGNIIEVGDTRLRFTRQS
jgi:hypothetical protein